MAEPPPIPCNTVAAARRALRAKEVSAEELTRVCLARIAALEPRLNALVTVSEETAIAAARRADERIARGDDAPLLGIPMVVKDLLATRGIRTTCGSAMLADFVPPYDAEVVARLGRAGAVLLGKANLDEFAMGSSNESSAFGPTRNPWDLERVPGGSSGGSAAAVAALECLAALGTDTGGSVRLPASFCGVSAIKPTYGRVSRNGVVAYASSLDQVGPFARTVADLADVLGVVAGPDPADSTCAPDPVPDYAASIGGDVRGLRIGLPREYFADGIDDEVRRAAEAAVEELRRLGASAREVSLPHTEYAIAAYYIIATAEASSNLARFDGVKYGLRREPEGSDLLAMYRATRDAGFGREVKRRILLGTYALSAGYYDAYYRKAQQVRTLVRRDFERAFAECDLLVTPTAPGPAFRLGERLADPVAMYLSDVFTTAPSLAGIPGLVVPCGATASGLPIGLQMLAPPLAEATLLRAGDAYQRATDWHERLPPIAAAEAR